MDTQMNMVQAINQALHDAMTTDPKVLVFGEDVAQLGGVFRATLRLTEQFGNRCFNTPLTEQGIIGFANGLAAHGMKPIAEIQFADYIFPAFDQITNETAKFRYRSGNQFNVGGLTIRAPYGGGIKGGLYHSQSPEAYFTHTPGLKVVIPSTAYDAKGLLTEAINTEDPVIFFEPKKLYRKSKSIIPAEPYSIPIGEANIIKHGSDVTLVAWGAQVEVITEAAEIAAKQGIDCEIIDLRSLAPWDKETVAQSVCKTGRAIIVQEAPKTGGFAGEIAAVIHEECFLNLLAPITRICGLDTPFNYSNEDIYMPNAARVNQQILKIMDY